MYHDEIGHDHLFAVFTARLESFQTGSIRALHLTDTRISIFETTGCGGETDSRCGFDGACKQEVF